MSDRMAWLRGTVLVIVAWPIVGLLYVIDPVEAWSPTDILYRTFLVSVSYFIYGLSWFAR